MSNPDMSRATWRKSSRSGQNGNCVEVAPAPGHVAIRDSKAPDAGHVSLDTGSFTQLVARVKRGHYDI